MKYQTKKAPEKCAHLPSFVAHIKLESEPEITFLLQEEDQHKHHSRKNKTDHLASA